MSAMVTIMQESTRYRYLTGVRIRHASKILPLANLSGYRISKISDETATRAIIPD